jgi:hypothetical protein
MLYNESKQKRRKEIDMAYIDALKLINLAIENDLLGEQEGKVFVYRAATSRSEEGWYLDDKDIVAKELMNDEKGQKTIIEVLKEKGVSFVPKEY